MRIIELAKYLVGGAIIYGIVAACTADHMSSSGGSPTSDGAREGGFVGRMTNPVLDAKAQMASSCQQWTVRIGVLGDQSPGEEPFAAVEVPVPNGPTTYNVFTRRCLR